MRIMKDGVVTDALPAEEALLQADAVSRIEELKALLSSTDYRTLKYVEGGLTEEEFAAFSSERAAWRAEINRLEQEL